MTKAAVEVGGVRITSPDDVLYPGQGITKRELAAYYQAVAPRMLPHLKGRPLTLMRCPEGEGGACFYQRHAAERGPLAALGRVTLTDAEGGRDVYLTVTARRGLLTLAQMRVLEVHVWNARADRPDRPDRLVLDLDPGPGVAWRVVVDAALELRERLAGAGLVSFVKTTGGRGLHLVAPLIRRYSWERVRGAARALAESAAADAPDRFLVRAARAERDGRIYLDYLRNAWGASIVAPFSTRARPGAPVSTPLTWDELPDLTDPGELDVRSVPRRIAARRTDAWEGFAQARQGVGRLGIRD